MNILHADEMNKLDEYAIGHIGIMQCVLMERAALGVSDCILKQFEKPSVLVLSGPGNCGGDGLALARILLDRGLNVRVYLPVALEKCKESVQNEAKLFESFGGKILSVLPDEGAEVIVDAVFGVGLNRPVTGAFLDAIKWMNNQKEKSQAYIFSVDIPSGIHTDTGAVMGDAVKADYTVTFSCLKPGLLLYPGREYAGEISVSSIGIDSLTDTIIEPTCYTFSREEARLSKRSPYGNKGSFHRILIIAGSRDMCGAAVLASTAAFRSGAGLVEVYTHENNRDVLLSALPEAIVHTYPDFVETEELKSALARADSVLIGPGLSAGDAAKKIMDIVLEGYNGPLVLDADAINILSADGELKGKFLGFAKNHPVVLTPHPMELSRFTGLPREDLLTNYEKSVRECAKENNCVIVGKGATTLVSDGERVYYNLSGNDGMATGGSGDVLAGMIATFIVNEKDFFTGITLAVFRHGLAGESASELWGRRSALAADLWKGILE